jgi:uncharacterized protein (DUF697 family)
MRLFLVRNILARWVGVTARHNMRRAVDLSVLFGSVVGAVVALAVIGQEIEDTEVVRNVGQLLTAGLPF